jgi:hypothetical protein
MNLEKRINAFVKLGKFLKQFKSKVQDASVSDLNELFYADFEELICRQKSYNGWFDEVSVREAIGEVSSSLAEEELKHWVACYNLNPTESKVVGVIMAGNIPLVGFHDFLCVLISGNSIQAKLSSNDNTLLKKIAEVLITISFEFSERISFVEQLSGFDAVIATGSNNTARYFIQYFGKYPHIIRKNRSSVAIVAPKDDKEVLKNLGRDVFQYYGLGCRSISKVYIPKGFKLDLLFEAIYDYKDVLDNHKYANNYDYNKAVYLLGNNKLLDNNFLLLKESTELDSPVGVLNYEYYEDVLELMVHLDEIKEDLQCIVSSDNTPMETFAFGESQCPRLDDYADGVDTLKFLSELS